MFKNYLIFILIIFSVSSCQTVNYEKYSFLSLKDKNFSPPSKSKYIKGISNEQWSVIKKIGDPLNCKKRIDKINNLKGGNIITTEDFDVNLQLLTRGFKNRVSAKYMVGCSNTNADGGCSTWRTLEVHNEAQRILHELWPDFIKIREKEVTSGPWKGQVKLATTIQHKKAYESSQQNSLEEFFA